MCLRKAWARSWEQDCLSGYLLHMAAYYGAVASYVRRGGSRGATRALGCVCWTGGSADPAYRVYRHALVLIRTGLRNAVTLFQSAHTDVVQPAQKQCGCSLNHSVANVSSG